MDAFTVVADPTRRRILDELRGRERTVTDLVSALGAAQPTVSKHLRVLRDSRMVASTVDAQHRRYRLEEQGLRELEEWVSAFRRLWTTRLDALEAPLAGRDRCPRQCAARGIGSCCVTNGSCRTPSMQCGEPSPIPRRSTRGGEL